MRSLILAKRIFPHCALRGMTRQLAAVILAGFMTAPAADDSLPSLTEQYTMFYYRDLVAPRHFYGDILGLKTTYEDEWVTLYQVVPGALVGVVREGGTAQHRAQPESAVMLSMVTTDLESWYRRLKRFPEVRFIKEMYDHDSAPIRALLLEDPGGYTVEMFQWLEK